MIYGSFIINAVGYIQAYFSLFIFVLVLSVRLYTNTAIFDNIVHYFLPFFYCTTPHLCDRVPQGNKPSYLEGRTVSFLSSFVHELLGLSPRHLRKVTNHDEHRKPLRSVDKSWPTCHWTFLQHGP